MDDDPAVLRAVSRLLRARGFLARSFAAGREFIAALPYGLPACLIIDFEMPEMNGLEVRRHLVSNAIEIPAILVTGHVDVASLGVGRRDFVASLQKPFLATALFAAIDRARSVGQLRSLQHPKRVASE